MSYGKKDEDADQAIVKVDRTSVFQEGMDRSAANYEPLLTGHLQQDCLTPHLFRQEDVVSF